MGSQYCAGSKTQTRIPISEVITAAQLNKNPERETGVQPKYLKSKAEHWLLPRPQSEMAILTPEIAE